MKSSPLINISQLGTRIGDHTLLRDVSLDIFKGETVALLGRNGSGKSSVLKSIMGLYPAHSGKILFEGECIRDKDVYEMANLGIGYIPEDQELFDTLTIEENMMLAVRNQDDVTSKRMDALLSRFPDLKHHWKSLASILSGGQRQMLAVARCLVNENRLVLIDEPSKGLAPVLVNELILLLQSLKGKETIVLVEQNIRVAAECADRCYILNDGTVVKEMIMETLMNDEETMRTYLGISG